jgi:hypothetical protein
MYTVENILAQCRDTLTDYEKIRWTDSELLGYFNEAVNVLASERNDKQKSITFALDSTENTYIINGVLRYISAEDSNGINRKLYLDEEDSSLDSGSVLIVNQDEVYVSTPEDGVNLTIKYIGMPSSSNMNSNVRVGDEVALKYYILSKSYEKESDTESFQKSEVFGNKFSKELRRLMNDSSVRFIDSRSAVNVTSSYFF